MRISRIGKSTKMMYHFKGQMMWVVILKFLPTLIPGQVSGRLCTCPSSEKNKDREEVKK